MTVDLVVQLASAFVIVDSQAASEPNADTNDDLQRARMAIASALPVILRSDDGMAEVSLRDSAAESVGLVFDRRFEEAEVPA